MPLKWVFHWQPNAGTTVNSQMLTEVSQCAESINGVKEGRWKATLTFYKPMFRDQAVPAEYPRDFLGISLPEQPNRYYFIIRSQKIVLEADSSIQMIMEKLQSYKSRVSLTFEGFQYQLGDFQLRVGKVAPSASENLRGIVLEVAEHSETKEDRNTTCKRELWMVCWSTLFFFFSLSNFRHWFELFLAVDALLLFRCGLLSNLSISLQFQVEYLPLSSMEKSRQILDGFVEIWQEAMSKRSLPGHFMHIEPNFAEFGLSDHYTSQHTAVQYATVMAQLISAVQTAQAVRN